MNITVKGRHARRDSEDEKDPTVITTYGDARALTPGTRVIDANGDHWLRKGASVGASLEPVHRPPTDALLLAIAQPARALPHGPFAIYSNDPRFPACATHYSEQARQSLRTATHHLNDATQRAGKLPPEQREQALGPVRIAHERAHDAEQLAVFAAAAYDAFRTLTHLPAHESPESYAKLAALATHHADQAAHEAARAALEAEHALSNIPA